MSNAEGILGAEHERMNKVRQEAYDAGRRDALCSFLKQMQQKDLYSGVEITSALKVEIATLTSQ